MPSLSIIIPTHKRPQILKECLRHLAVQTIRDQLEVIVVHDGEDDAETRSVIPSWVTYFSIPKSQQGVARNRGVEVATAPIVLFGQDDIFFAPDACEKHLKAHETSLTAVLGFTEWDPAVGITDVMRWLDRTGWQFGYVKLKKFRNRCVLKNIQHRFTYTSNLSVPYEVAKRVQFLEEVSLYGWEDIEWGLRLRKCGIPLFYEPDARALHHHKITLEQSLDRMETLGRSLPEITDINPSLDRMPAGWKLLAYKILSRLPTLRGQHYKAFLKGMGRA
ncbi:MAG TPA: glycosyltransferase [Candidatus Peribacteraceae bacterium]|nr:glycosyltransferase [Candidatus Peribacteraceae bacterium]